MKEKNRIRIAMTAFLSVIALSAIGFFGSISEVSAATVPSSVQFSGDQYTKGTISWSGVDDATYNVYRAESRFASYSKIADGITETSYTDLDYDGGYYKVSAVVDGSESALSDEASYEISLFGYDTYIFEDTDDTSSIQSCIDEAYKTTEAGQFVDDRYAFMFAPGTYSDDLTVDVGFYTQVAGLGLSPEDTVIGNICCKAEWMIGRKYDGGVNYSALCNFWRSVENLTTTAKSTMWAVSQATSMRRMNIKGSLYLHEEGGYASGGFLADSKIAGTVSSGSQQQWITRNSQMNHYDGAVWNSVLVGCGDSIDGVNDTWPSSANTNVPKTPEILEKPFLAVDDNGNYGVFVPNLRTDCEGVSWDVDDVESTGTFHDIDEFYVASPTDSVEKINDALADGKSLILTPGIYKVSEPMRVTNENTIVLGLGLATIQPTAGNECMTVADVGGVEISGILFDAGSTKSSCLLTVGEKDSKTDHSDNPIALCDTFYRVGGASADPCKVTTCLTINSSNVIGDNFWIWRADHGSGVGWNKNTADYGIVVNGENVTTYGLMVEHFQKYQTQWNADGGKCYMYQSELPYDIESQSSWNAPGTYGYADYKVASSVKSHEGYGIGIYSCYQAATCYLKSGLECPDTDNVKFTNVCTYSLSGNGTIDYAINNAGYGVWASGEMCKIMSYCNGKYTMDKTEATARKYMWTTKVTIKGQSDITKRFKVAYTGKKYKPTITISYSGIPLREGTDYTITYKNNKKIGNGTIKVNGVGNFTDKNTYKFKIVPKKAKIKKISANSKKITIKLKKIKGAGGYQVVYATNKKLKHNTKVNAKKTKITVKRKSNKAYYVKVRAYKKKGGKYFYGAYSKKAKVKKVASR